MVRQGLDDSTFDIGCRVRVSDPFTLTRRSWLRSFFAGVLGLMPGRSALIAGLGLETARGLATGHDRTPRGPTRCFRQFNLDWSWIALRPAEITEFFKEASPRAIAQFLAGSEVDGTVVMAVPHHGYCTHNTKVGERFPALKYDWFGAMVEELHGRNISAFGYVTLNWNWKYIREHLGADFIHGTPDAEGVCGGRVMICLNAPGYLELVEAYTEEVLRQYPVDGMRWDILKTPRGCRCEGCRRLYREAFGEEWPQNGVLSPTAMDEMYDLTIERAVRRLSRICKALRPNVEIWQNHLNPYFPNPLHLAREMDVAYNEFGDPFRLLLIKGVSRRPAVINGLMNQAPTEPPQPIDGASWRLTLALGGRCYSYYGHKHTNPRTLLPDDQIRRWHREQLAPFYRMVREIQPWLEGSEPVSDIAILFCDRTRFRFPQRDRLPYLRGMESWVAELIAQARPPVFVDVVDFEPNSQAAAGWSALVVPLTSGLTDRELARLRDYVRRGGTVFVVGDALRHDAQGLPLEDFAVGPEMGLKWRELLSPGPAVAIKSDFLESYPEKLHLGEPIVHAHPIEGKTWLWMHLPGDRKIPLLHLRDLESSGRYVWLAVPDPSLVLWTVSRLIGPGPVRVETASARAILCYQPHAHRWILHLLSDGEICVALDARRVPVRRITARYPLTGWQAEIQTTAEVHRITAGGEARNRLLVLEP